MLVRTFLKEQVTESQINEVLAFGFQVKDCGETIEIWAQEMATV